MNTDHPLDRPLFTLRVGEFLEIIKENNKPVIIDHTPRDEKYVYGIVGLCTLFNCSKKTAFRIKNSGKIDKAIKLVGRKIIVDAEMALKLLDGQHSR